MKGACIARRNFALAARELGTIEQADELLAMLERRPGREAWRGGQLMVASAESRGRLATAARRRAGRPSGSS
jgi:hypothetical protein